MFNKLINEKLYGMQSVVYHRTRSESIVNNIIEMGFEVGYGNSYGGGLYSCYDLNSQLIRKMETVYGNVIIKMVVFMKNILILDYNEAKHLYGNKEYDVVSQLKMFGIKEKDIDDEIMKISDMCYDEKWTSDHAFKLINNYKIRKILNGIVFTGRHDGKVLVCYNTKLVTPVSFCETENGKIISDWKKVSTIDSIKKYLKSKKQLMYDDECMMMNILRLKLLLFIIFLMNNILRKYK